MNYCNDFSKTSLLSGSFELKGCKDQRVRWSMPQSSPSIFIPPGTHLMDLPCSEKPELFGFRERQRKSQGSEHPASKHHPWESPGQERQRGQSGFSSAPPTCPASLGGPPDLCVRLSVLWTATAPSLWLPPGTLGGGSLSVRDLALHPASPTAKFWDK